MTRVAFLHGSNDLYGASRVLLQDVEVLVGEGYDVTVTLPDDGPLTDELTRRGAEAGVHDLRVLRKVGGLGSLRPPVALPPLAQESAVIVIWTLALCSYLPVARARRRRCITSVHEILPGKAGSVLARGVATLSHDVMFNSRTTAEWFSDQLGGSSAGTPNVAYPVAPPFSPLPTPTTPRGEVHALIAGRVNGHKGHLEAVEASRLARASGVDLRLTLVGGSYPGQESHLQAVLDEIAEEEWAVYAGEVPDIRAFLAQSHVVLMPTTTPEPFGVIALEAWAAGRRLLGSDEGGLSEAIRLVDGVPVQPRSIEALARALITVAADPVLLGVPSEHALVAIACTLEARRNVWRRVLDGYPHGRRR